MFKTAAQIADGEDADPPAPGLFVSAAQCLTEDAIRKGADGLLSTPRTLDPREPAPKQAPMARSRPVLSDQSPTRSAVQRSPVKRSAISTNSIPPSIVRLLETVKDRLSSNLRRHNIDLNTYKTHLHILPLRQIKSYTHEVSPMKKGHEEVVGKHAISIPRLSSSTHINLPPGANAQIAQLWAPLINNKIYDCLVASLVGRATKEYQSTVRTLIRLLDCNDVYFDMVELTQTLLSHQHLLQSLPSRNSYTLFPPPLVPPHLLLRALASDCKQRSTSLDLLTPCFARLLAAYTSQSLFYNPYTDALIGKQKAITRHKELGSPRFCTYIPSRTAPHAFEQLSMVYGATVLPAFDTVSGTKDSSSVLYDSSHEYELHRLSFLSGTLAENFSLCKAAAFAVVDNTLLMHQRDEAISGRTMYTLDAELLSHASLGTLEDSKLAGMVVLPYSHELEELIFCGTRAYDATAGGLGDFNFYYNPTVSQHADLITLIYTEICRYTDGILTTNRLYLILITLGLDHKLAGYEWFLLQYQLSIFRLAKTQLMLIKVAKPSRKDPIKSVMNPYTVLIHCMLKYKLEFDSDFVPLLKRIHRQDITANSCTAIYLILDTRVSQLAKPQDATSNLQALSSLNSSTGSVGATVPDVTPPIRPQQKTAIHKDSTPKESLELLVTDGFYLVKASVDSLLFNFLTKNKVCFHKHEKILVSLPQTLNFGSAQEPPIKADWSTEETLVLTYYNTRIAPKSHFLGRFHRPFISMSLSDAVGYALGTRLHSQQAGDTNLVPHMSALVVRVFDSVVIVKKVQGQATADSGVNAENETKTYCYRRILVVDPDCIDTACILKLSEDPEFSPSNFPQLACLFLHQFGSKASIIESFEPGLQIELISTSIKRYNPRARGAEGAPSGSYLQLSPSAIICSQAANVSLPRELRNAFNACYQNCFLSVHNTNGGLELLCDHTVFFYCLGTSASIPPMYCFQLSEDSSRVFDLIEVIQGTNMSTIFVHSAKEQTLENEMIELRNPPRKLTKLIIKAAIIQDKGHGKYRLMCLDETVIKATGDLFFHESEDQTDMYVQILEESIHKYL